MALQLHCKRAKLFMRHDGKKSEKVRCPRGEVTTVPDWVKDDPGYAAGLKDKSIVDLTPPKPAPVTAPKPVPVTDAAPAAPAESDAPPSDSPAAEIGADAEDDAEEGGKKNAGKGKKSANPKGLQSR